MILFDLFWSDGVDDFSDAIGGLSNEMILSDKTYTLKAV